MVGVPHQGAQPIIVDTTRGAAVGAAQPEQGAGLRAGHEFIVVTHRGVVVGWRQRLDKLTQGEVGELVEVSDAVGLTEACENLWVVGDDPRENLKSGARHVESGPGGGTDAERGRDRRGAAPQQRTVADVVVHQRRFVQDLHHAGQVDGVAQRHRHGRRQ